LVRSNIEKYILIKCQVLLNSRWRPFIPKAIHNLCYWYYREREREGERERESEIERESERERKRELKRELIKLNTTNINFIKFVPLCER
jgi:hypothetical protein